MSSPLAMASTGSGVLLSRYPQTTMAAHHLWTTLQTAQKVKKQTHNCCRNSAICKMQLPSSVTGIRIEMWWAESLCPACLVRMNKRQYYLHIRSGFCGRKGNPSSVCLWEITTPWRNAYSAIWITERNRQMLYPFCILTPHHSLKYTTLCSLRNTISLSYK